MDISHQIKRRLLHVYGGEIVRYEETISASFSKLLVMSSYPRPPSAPIHDCIRHIFSDSALISLMLFPAIKSKFSTQRAKTLREEFKLEENSLLENRYLRNHLAHLDERLDKWAIESDQKTFGRGLLGSREDAARIGLNGEDILGLFDPKTLVFGFLQDDLRVDDLVSEIRNISQNVRVCLRDLPWQTEEDSNVH